MRDAHDIIVEPNSVNEDHMTRIHKLFFEDNETKHYDIFMISQDSVITDITYSHFSVNLLNATIGMNCVYSSDYRGDRLEDLTTDNNGNLASVHRHIEANDLYIFYVDDDNIEEKSIEINGQSFKALVKKDTKKYFCTIFNVDDDSSYISTITSIDCNVPKLTGTNIGSYLVLIFNFLNYIGYKDDVTLIDESKIGEFSTKVPFLLCKGETIYMKYGFKPRVDNFINMVLTNYGNKLIDYKDLSGKIHKNKKIKNLIKKYFFVDKDEKKSEYAHLIEELSVYSFDTISNLIDYLYYEFEIKFKDWCNKTRLLQK